MKDERHRGNYKTTQNSVAAFDEKGTPIGIVFETATPFDTPRLMAELTTWFQDERAADKLHPLLLIGVWVVVFLQIHPFQDGNGRLSRLTSVSRNTLKQHFRALVERGHLNQQGSGRGAWYELK